MTNLLEKGLIIGFGIITLLIFFSLISPFLETIANFDNNEENDIKDYISFINEMDQAILYVIDNPEEDFLKSIEYPTNLNITLYNQYAKYDFIIGDELLCEIIFYNESFVYNIFQDFISKTYLLNVSFVLNLIKIQFIDYY
ncbi:MAG: hypothetical protein ACFE8L_03885 [Candidatus Hodarchaeota archaeon]